MGYKMARSRNGRSDDGVPPEEHPSPSSEPLVFNLTTPGDLLGDVASFLLKEAQTIFQSAKDMPHMEKYHLKGVAHVVKALAFRIDRATLEIMEQEKVSELPDV